MTFRLQLVTLVASCLLTAAFSVAQTDDVATLLKKANAGDAKAQFDLASAYSQGVGVEKDPAKGLEWLRKSASQGYAGAEVVLGYFYQKGMQIQQDPSEAAKWYRRAAKQADKDPKHAQTAQGHLSEMLAQGVISAREADWHAQEQSTTSGRQTQSNEPAPFSLGEVETGLAGGITSKRMATLVTTYGVNFSLNDGAKKRLSGDGADDNLLQTIASSKR